MGAPAMIVHLVQVVKLHSNDSVDRQIMAHTAHLPAGSRVRVKVGEIRAWHLTGMAWYRPDLIWRFESENPDVLPDWDHRLGELVQQ
jgi:hypothetical protein